MRLAILQLTVAVAFTGLLRAQDSSIFINEAKQLFDHVSDNILKSAEEMPAEDYGFRPTPESQSFADWIGDIAASESDACSAVDGKRIGAGEKYSPSDKMQLIWMLRRATQRCDAAYSSINSFTASEEIGFGRMRRSKLGFLFWNASQANEVYGHLADYLRLKGLAPPSDKARMLPVD